MNDDIICNVKNYRTSTHRKNKWKIKKKSHNLPKHKNSKSTKKKSCIIENEYDIIECNGCNKGNEIFIKYRLKSERVFKSNEITYINGIDPYRVFCLQCTISKTRQCARRMCINLDMTRYCGDCRRCTECDSGPYKDAIICKQCDKYCCKTGFKCSDGNICKSCIIDNEYDLIKNSLNDLSLGMEEYIINILTGYSMGISVICKVCHIESITSNKFEYIRFKSQSIFCWECGEFICNECRFKAFDVLLSVLLVCQTCCISKEFKRIYEQIMEWTDLQSDIANVITQYAQGINVECNGCNNNITTNNEWQFYYEQIDCKGNEISKYRLESERVFKSNEIRYINGIAPYRVFCSQCTSSKILQCRNCYINHDMTTYCGDCRRRCTECGHHLYQDDVIICKQCDKYCCRTGFKCSDGNICKSCIIENEYDLIKNSLIHLSLGMEEYIINIITEYATGIIVECNGCNYNIITNNVWQLLQIMYHQIDCEGLKIHKYRLKSERVFKLNEIRYINGIDPYRVFCSQCTIWGIRECARRWCDNYDITRYCGDCRRCTECGAGPSKDVIICKQCDKYCCKTGFKCSDGNICKSCINNYY